MFHRAFWILGVLSILSMCTRVTAAEEVDYLRDVKPILAHRCYSCHGALRQKAGLRLDTAELARQGGDSGPALVAGDSSQSLLIHRATGARGMKRMPPASEGAGLGDK